MAYAKETYNYGIPYISANEILDGTQEEIAAQVIDNQLRAGILGAGGTRVFQNGGFGATIVDPATGRVEVTLSPSGSGNPSVQGIANGCLIEVGDPITWTNLAANSFYFLYVQANNDTFSDAGSVGVVSSESPLVREDYLFLATVNTTGTDNHPAIAPVVDPSPPGKPTAFNLFNLLNNNSDPFGPSLTQSILTVLSQLSVLLDQDTTTLIQQLSVDATLSALTVENHSRQPDIAATAGPLRLADLYVPGGFALSDPASTSYQGTALSLLGALNEILSDLMAHVANNHNPHGTTLYQDALVLAHTLTVPQVVITPPPPAPPGPPSPPPPPGQLAYYDLRSSGELRIGDSRGGLFWSDDTNTYYLGAALSLIGALNELRAAIATLAGDVGGLTGSTLPALMPVVFEIQPEDLGLDLHFKVTIAQSEDFSNVIVARESRTSATGWFYEYQAPPPPAPPAPPSPPINPYALPGLFIPPAPRPLPVWTALPSGGLGADRQRHLDGRPVRVKYETQAGDNISCRRRYAIAIQEYNGEYGDAELAALAFD